ncbi:MAG: FAD-binding and (Fe-S)-binding domain-containing protein [Verrucomicrobiota bacterium]|nr:FAD-binding and (Fe-S)-binding domain-containing protein [Verrucomicrobiota bacterium]
MNGSLDWQVLKRNFSGDLFTDRMLRLLYATDASAYQEMPLAVAIPKTEGDIGALIQFARRHKLGLIPRTAGTSLAGQVVGSGIVVDVSRHFTRILEIDAPGRRVRVQPGVIRNELNLALKPYGLLFGPETSTANRAMMGGMFGNNSCGSNSVVYGSTREHVISVRGFLSDGSEAAFGAMDEAAFTAKCNGPADRLETKIYQQLSALLANPANRKAITDGYPKPSITRRNTGYALDLLMDAKVFDPASSKPFNLCKLLAGSEGTLFFATELELNCLPLPPPESVLVCAHFTTINEALRANLIALKYQPHASELIDRFILNCTKSNITQRRNRDFVEGDPGAVLVVELRGQTRGEMESAAAAVEAEMRDAGLGYAFPKLYGAEGNKVWDLRRAGQGLLSNIPGDTKPVEVCEDTAVDVEDLPEYITEFDALMRDRFGIGCVYYAHAGSGELHTRPMINLKTPEGNAMFRDVAQSIATLVKKYRGSLSGEHGDGRLRGEFIEYMVGADAFKLIRETKRIFDPDNCFNPGKIVNTPPMNSSLRHGPEDKTPDYETYFDFAKTQGVLRAAELCSGSGDCRKTQLTGGTMCPSYMATRDEKDTTRARANMLRHVLTHPQRKNPFDSEEIYAVMDLCLSCKGCKSECPSNVDVGRLKAEFLQHYYEANGTPLRSRMVGNFPRMAALFSHAPWLWNLVTQNAIFATPMKLALGFATGRSLPPLSASTARKQIARSSVTKANHNRGSLYLYVDEFTNCNDAEIGLATYTVLTRLGYEVKLIDHPQSARALLSKGLLKEALILAEANVNTFATLIAAETPLVGIEPSAILGFRDEFPDLLRGELQKKARAIAPHCLLFEEFIAREIDAGRITAKDFDTAPRAIHLHGHCHQKSLTDIKTAIATLSLPVGHTVTTIPSGCCGMAGSFGYEKEHFALSQQVGELVLFPAIRKLDSSAIIAASGTSCRHQIHDGVQRRALHSAEILLMALKA